jgi:deoxycytidylate deaminase
MQSAFNRLEYPELFIGMVAPVGVNTSSTIDSISKFFIQNNYEVITLKVTDYFDSLKRALDIDLPLEVSPTDRRILTYINFGNRLRQEFNDDSVLAAYMIFKIMQHRERSFRRKGEINYQNRVYILHQFKRKEEIDLLRSVYDKLFFQVSVYSRKESRIEYLSHKLAHERNTADQSDTRSIAMNLVSKDENEKLEPHGQRITKIFHDADLIINSDRLERGSVEIQVFRFFDLVFSSNSISPSKQEYGMFAAKAAALRTLDLSRQVGAAIFHSSGEIASLGSNEVPKAGGGTYWSDEVLDAREYTKKEDSNDSRKKELLREIFQASSPELTFTEFLNKSEVRDSQFMDALEYGRIIHAEMSAITDAARLGISLKDTTLFCTTFPCHMCAKHIVSSGIKSVIFLEPYPKSLAADLHSDSIEIENGMRGRYDDYPAVKFEHFSGITPRRYRELFERGSRKKDGLFQDHIKGKRRPNVDLLAPFYLELEQAVVSAGFSEFELILARRN